MLLSTTLLYIHCLTVVVMTMKVLLVFVTDLIYVTFCLSSSQASMNLYLYNFRVLECQSVCTVFQG